MYCKGTRMSSLLIISVTLELFLNIKVFFTPRIVNEGRLIDPLPLSPCHKATSVGFLSTGGGGLSHRRRCCTAQAEAPGQTFAAPLAEPRGGNSRRRPALRMPCPAARVVCSVACELWGNVGTQPLCPNRQPGACALPFPPRTPRQDA